MSRDCSELEANLRRQQSLRQREPPGPHLSPILQEGPYNWEPPVDTQAVRERQYTRLERRLALPRMLEQEDPA